MKIVGVGCGPGMLTEEAIAAIEGATTIYGSERAIDIARPHIFPSCPVKSIDDYKALRELTGDFVVLSTGDPMLAGLGYLSGNVIPGISSLQIAAARLRVPLARVVVVVAHGTGHESAIRESLDELGRKKIVFMLTDPKFDVSVLYRQLADFSGPIRIAVCENLGYPDERISTGPISSPPHPVSGLYILFIGDF